LLKPIEQYRELVKITFNHFFVVVIYISNGECHFSTHGVFVVLKQPSEFLAQLQRIIAQLYKMVYENVKGWYF